MSSQIHSLSCDGFSLNYEIRGKGPAVLVVGSHIYYPRVFSKQLEEHLQLIYMDQRAFASKEGEVKASDFTLEKLVQDIERLRQALALDKITLIGHSIHAFFVLEYARKYPEHVNRLVLSASSPFAGNRLFLAANQYFEESVDPLRKKQLAANSEWAIEQKSEDPFVGRMLQLGPMLWYDPAFDASNLWKGVALDPLGSHLIWNQLFSDYELSSFDQLETPVLLLLGRYDYFNPPHLWEGYRSKFKDLTLRIFEKSGHTPSFEESESFNSELLRWLL